MKQQILHIHGGEVFDSQDQYLHHLKNVELYHMEPSVFNPWYKNYLRFLEDEKFQIISPPMPCAENSKYIEWKIWFDRHLKYLRNDIILVGHSLGGIFLAKYLAENDFPVTIKQLHLVAPVYDYVSEVEQLADFRLGDFPGKLPEKTIPEIHLYASQDDDVVPFTESEKYYAQIPGSQLHVFKDRGHFLGEEFPELFENIMK